MHDPRQADATIVQSKGALAAATRQTVVNPQQHVYIHVCMPTRSMAPRRLLTAAAAAMPCARVQRPIATGRASTQASSKQGVKGEERFRVGLHKNKCCLPRQCTPWACAVECARGQAAECGLPLRCRHTAGGCRLHARLHALACCVQRVESGACRPCAALILRPSNTINTERQQRTTAITAMTAGRRTAQQPCTQL